MILVDHQIQAAVNKKEIEIDNFSPDCIQPASYDLRIGDKIYTSTSKTPEIPIDLTSNGGAFRLPPYGNALLMTYEKLKLSKKYIGRFGLKSGFARRGLIASTGPQVDPGFDGKLFITIFNLLPISRILSYKEKFLTIEFHLLDNEPDKPYEGRYQHKEDITPDILDDIVRLEGLNLNQVQSQFSELSENVKRWNDYFEKIGEFIDAFKVQSEALNKTIELYTSGEFDKTPQKKIIIARDLSIEQATQEIYGLFQKNKNLYYSDIAEKLNLDYSLVVEACEKLIKNGLIEEEPNE